MKVIAQRNNKVDIFEKELIEIKQLVQDLTIDVERVCLECDKFQSKFSCSELRREELVENLKCELCRVTFEQEEEECLGAEHMMKKIDENFKLELTVERYEEKHDNELECEKK